MRESLIRSQCGVGLIVVILILFTMGLIGAVLVALINSESFTALHQSAGLEAIGIAEGGVQRALYQFKNGTTCNSLDTTNLALGSGDVDIDGTLYNPSSPTTLSAGISSTDTTIPVASIAGYGPHGRLRIESEDMNYAGTSTTSCGAFSPPCFTGAQRGMAGTTAVSHSGGVAVSQDQCLIRSTGSVSGPVAGAQRILEVSAASPGTAGAMMVYAKAATDAIPYFRRWDGSAWGTEQQATSVPAAIQYLVLKFARTRNEAVLGTLSSTGDLRVQVWNGSSWSATTLLANIGTTNDAYRGLDIEYETAGDRAVVAYNNANAADPAYRVWNGTTWSAPATIDIPTTGAPFWIELAPNPLSASNEIVLMTLDANVDVYGMRWDGSSWSNMGVITVWDATASIATRKAIDVTYEQISGRAMFIWGDSVATDQYYRIWNGSTLTAATLLDISAEGGVAQWVRLVPRPGSNQLMYGVQDAGADLNTRVWTGSGWDAAHVEHDAAVEDILDRNFDIVWETFSANAGKAWLVWGDGATVSRRQWNSDTSSWGAITTVGDDTALVQLMADPGSGAVFAALYEDSTSATDDTWEMRLTGGGSIWSAKFTVWGGPTVANPVMERVFLAAERLSSGGSLIEYDRLEVYP